MRQYDLDDPTEVVTALARSESGARWELQEEAHLRWWRALAEDDRAEFVGVYGGDELLSRFVCALDYLSVVQAKGQTGQTIVEAYAIAAHLPSNSEAARAGAAAAWKHDAVQALVDRLRYRSNRQACARITSRATAVIEQMLLEAANPDAGMKDREAAAKTALAFMRLVSDEDVQERVERTKRGFQKARAELKVEDEIPTEDQASLYLKVLESQLGKDVVKRLVLGTDASG